MDSAQQEFDNGELELLELALVQSRRAMDNIEEIIREHWRLTNHVSGERSHVELS